MFARNQKPYTSTDELAGPADPASHPAASSLHHALAGPLWLIAGIAIAGVALGIPGCVGTGGPTVSAKGEVSVKEVAHHVAMGGPGDGRTGELAANVSFTLTWPNK